MYGPSDRSCRMHHQRANRTCLCSFLTEPPACRPDNAIWQRALGPLSGSRRFRRLNCAVNQATPAPGPLGTPALNAWLCKTESSFRCASLMSFTNEIRVDRHPGGHISDLTIPPDNPEKNCAFFAAGARAHKLLRRGLAGRVRHLHWNPPFWTTT